MTVIVGYIDSENNKIYMGADSMASNSLGSCTHRLDSKVFINKGFIFGFTSSYRMGQLLMSSKFNPPVYLKTRNLFDYMITDFIDHIRTIFSENGYTEINNNVESGGEFLVGYRGHLYKIASDFQVEESHDMYNAAGHGASIALGALYTFKECMNDVPIWDRISTAICAAKKYSCYCGGNIIMEYLEKQV